VTKVGLGGITGNRQALYATLVVMLVLLGVPQLHNGYLENLFRGILMFSAMSLGWNLIGGYTGYVSFGNVVYFGLGSYTAATLSTHGVHDVFVAIATAVLVAVVFAALFGPPILRLKGHYFGIATLGLALATQEIISNLDYFGGGTGLPVHQDAFFSLYYYAMWAVCMAALLGTYLIARSKLGYALVAIRENEDAATVLGVNPTLYKVTAWALSGMMAAAAGAVFGFANGFIDPDTAFSVDNNIFPIVMALLGGVGTVAGPVAGAFILTAINETLWSHLPKVHTIFFGAVIVLVVLFLPRGLMYLFRKRQSARVFLESLRAYRV
jgi:branched-chain amino acid transport system permease protein